MGRPRRDPLALLSTYLALSYGSDICSVYRPDGTGGVVGNPYPYHVTEGLPVMRVKSTESHVLVAKNRLACAAPPALELYVERV
jgi:hypothetical protein